MNHTKFVLDKKNLVIEHKLSFYLSDGSVTFEIGQKVTQTGMRPQSSTWRLSSGQSWKDCLKIHVIHIQEKKGNRSFCHIQPQMLTLYPVRIVGATDFTGVTLYPFLWGNMINNVQMTHIQKMMRSLQSELLNVLQLQSLLHPLYVCVEKSLKHCFWENAKN